MKKNLIVVLIFSLFLTTTKAQGLKDIFNKVTKKDSSAKGNVALGNGLSNGDIINGLKEALKIGTDSSSKKLSKVNGFFGDAAIKILLPAEAQKVEKTLRGVGMGSLVDKAILSMNRAAEDAASGVGNIFFNSIKFCYFKINITIFWFLIFSNTWGFQNFFYKSIIFFNFYIWSFIFDLM